MSDARVVDIIVGGTQGLRRDAQIASEALRGRFDHRVHVSRQRNLQLMHRRVWRHALRPLLGRSSVSVFFENVPTAWLSVSPRNFLIPNQEWMRPETEGNLARCEQIWCKTRYAERLFRERGFDARYIGFASRDPYRADVPRAATGCVHVAGASHLKGTGALIALWERHPEWPPLAVVTHHEGFRRHESANLRIITRPLEQPEMDRLMNESGIHLCPSEAEGYGHYIAEALACGALVITVDAPPMNELVRPDYGLLVPAAREQPMGFGRRFFVDVDALEAQIVRALAMPAEERQARGALARAAHLAARADFMARFPATVDQVFA
jgi:glycosyltransferase involved in cell wall biosynthesis